MDIVIYCPGEAHKALRHNRITGKYAVVPKILFIADSNSRGKFKIQCNDSGCRKSGNTRGWHDIEIEPGRPPKVTPINMIGADGKPKHFNLKSMPVAVLGAED